MIKSLFAFLFLCGTSVWAQETVKGDHLRISWLAPKSFGKETQKIGLHFQIDPEWHVYWKNPGDSGAAPKFEILQNGKTDGIGPILWPAPHRLPVAHLTNIGYSTEVVYLFEVTPTADEVDLKVKLEWLVCKEECIPGFGELILKRPVTSQAVWDAKKRSLLASFDQRTPRNIESAPVSIQGEAVGNTVKLHLKQKKDLGTIDLFPVNGEVFNPAEPRKHKTETGWIFELQTNAGFKIPASSSFLIVAGDQAWEFTDVALPVAKAVATQPAAEPDVSLWLLLLSAFLGGLILNLMPCVLPVLSIKIMSLVKTFDGRHLRESLLYAAGVLTTFFLLGAVFLGLRHAGAAVGWGFQLQSPVVVLGLIVLFWLMALNFLGVFEIGTGVMNWAGGHSRSGSFMTGVLAVFVAAPCTGPFMGTVLGAASLLNTVAAMSLFLSLGAGLASPFVVLAMSPKLLKYLPKPGAWMESLKQFFAFPLFATVIWLLWVLAIQADTQGWLIACVLLLVISFCLWLLRSTSSVWKVLAWILVVMVGVVSVQQILVTEPAAVEVKTSSWVAFDPKVIQEARQAGRPVFIDFTAAWCITCQINKKVVLETMAVEEIFKKHNVLAVRADWTKYDPQITSALAELGRNSVPVYVFYPSDGSERRVLPQILSFDMIEELFQQKKEN